MNTRLQVIALLFACGMTLAGCTLVGCESEKKAEPTSAAGAPRSYSGPLPPLPPPQYPLPRPADVVRAVYDFAGRRPDVLHYMPCFCGCQASGHVGNDDCFVSSRDGSGKPTWDLHGMG